MSLESNIRKSFHVELVAKTKFDTASHDIGHTFLVDQENFSSSF